jgi:hypothetical protein
MTTHAGFRFLRFYGKRLRAAAAHVGRGDGAPGLPRVLIRNVIEGTVDRVAGASSNDESYAIADATDLHERLDFCREAAYKLPAAVRPRRVFVIAGAIKEW